MKKRRDSEMVSLEKKHINLSIGVAITIILFLIGITASFAGWKAEMMANHQEFDDRITHVGEKVIDMREDINTLKDKVGEADVQFATINTKLSNIEALLLELKHDLKDD